MKHTDVIVQPLGVSLAMSTWTYAEQDSTP